MIKRNIKFLLVILGFIARGLFVANSQVLVESIAAVVGNEVIYLSDLETNVIDMRRRDNRTPVDQLRCRVFQEMLVNKLFLDQARIDSITVGADAVEGELNMRINDAILRAGSEQALVDVFKKSMVEIRRDIKKQLLEQEVIREVQSKIAANLTLSPSALKRFYASIPKDSIPLIPAKYELSIIQLDPPGNEDNKAEARQKLLDIRSEILGGKSFSVLAVLNSDDTESRMKGGERGYSTRGQLEKEYADAAFSLTKNTVSRIVETKSGFHIIQLIDHKGDMVNTRHILIRPKVKPDQETRAISRLDSIANQIRKDSISFTNAALRYSTHKDSRINGGKYVSVDPSSRTTWFTLEELNTEMYKHLISLKIGEISDPFRTTDESNNDVFRIVKLDNEIPAHPANLIDDYQTLYSAALINERSKIFEKWLKDKIEVTYIKISDELKSCDFLKQGWLK